MSKSRRAPGGRGCPLPSDGVQVDERRAASLVRSLSRAGCVAAEEEALELLAAAADLGELRRLLGRRVAGEPLAWVVGAVSFVGRRVLVSDGVYVPRWQSEGLARRALELLTHDAVAVDLCTGSGAIALVLADAGARVVATELDARAAADARRNGVEVYVGDLDEPVPPVLVGRVDVVTAVPPYVPTAAIAMLPRDARDHEPRLALDGGADGCSALRRVLAAGARLLGPGGTLLTELGGDEPERLSDELDRLGYVDVAIAHDEEGDVRFLEARRPTR